MSPFKALVKQDAENLFLNPDEFGEVHTVDGRKMVIAIDDYEQQDRSKAVLDATDFEGIFNNRRLIYVRAREYGALPDIGKVLNLDGTPTRITKATDEDGIYALEIEGTKI